MYNYDRTVSANQRSFYIGHGIILGEDARGRYVRADTRFLDGHMLIIGKSGTGKSNLMRNLISELDTRNKGNTVVLDPHGTLSDMCIQSNKEKEMVYISPGTFDLSGEKRAISFNAIACDKGRSEQVERTTGWLRDMMANDDAFSSGAWGPRLDVIFKVVLGEVIRQHSDANLETLSRVITDRKEMRKFISSVGSDSVRQFLEGQYGDWRNWTQYISSSMNRLIPLLSSENTKYLISGEADSVDIRSLLKSGKALVTLNISRSSFSEDFIRIISSLFLLKIWTALLDTFREEGRSSDTYIFIDEFQIIPSRIIERLLSEGRKFGVHVILASQFLHPENKTLMQAIMGNVRNFVSFNVSDNDATEFARLVKGYRDVDKLADTVKQQRLHRAVIISHNLDGISGPLSFTPLYENSGVDSHIVRRLKELSLKKYALPVSDTIRQERIPGMHEEILNALESFLARKGIELLRSQRINGAVADGLFKYDGNDVVVEVEVSDLSKKFRVLSKLRSYPERKIILICTKGQAESLHGMIVEPTRFRIKKGLAMEFPCTSGSDEIYARDVAIAIPSTMILEYDEKGFTSYWNGKLRRFILKHLNEPSTFQRELERDSFGEIRSYIFRLMISSGNYAIQKSALLQNDVMKEKYVKSFLEKFSRDCSEFIFLKDLFEKKVS